MRKWLVAVFVLLLISGVASELLTASVRGYYRNDGTYVQPHQRSNPDGNPFNNYGFPGNSPILGEPPQAISNATWIDTMAVKGGRAALVGMARTRIPLIGRV